MIAPKSPLCALLLALVLPLVCLQLASDAQKTAQRWSSSSSSSASGSNPQSVYGGYQAAPAPVEQQRQVAAPVQQQRVRAQSYQSSRQTVERPQQVQQVYQQQESSYQEAQSSSAEADAEPASYGAVNGQPGRDFPSYQRVPKTSFSCEGVPYEYGMYADEETGCQAYHLCYNGRKESFLCGTGTVFNQRILHCDYWYSVDCAKSSQYYGSNAYMGSSQPEPGPAEANSAPVQQQSSSSSSSYSRTANRPAAPGGFKQQQQASFSRQTQQTQENY